jgi:cytochrome P450
MAGVDLTDLDGFADGFPHELFERHRREAPVYWHEPTVHTPGGEGFWSVATYAETEAVQLDPLTYSSERGGGRPHGGTMLQDLEVAGMVLSMMDDPRHNRIRRLVSSGLTPRTITRLEADLRRRTAALLDDVPDGEPFDFVASVARELPMQAICTLLGVPEADRHDLGAYFDTVFDVREGDTGITDGGPALRDGAAADFPLLDYCAALLATKREAPADDMLSVVVHASLPDLDPPRLDDVELYAFFSLLFAAGSETTRHALSGGLLALLERPDQLADLRAHRDAVLPTATEEILRWTSPSPAKRRTVTRPARLAGHDLAPGDKVLYWEASANRDELVFAEGGAFDVRRHPNPHLALGKGIHYCLGAHLARLEMRIVLEALLDRFTGLELTGPVEWTRSNRHSGIRHLTVRFTRSG